MLQDFFFRGEALVPAPFYVWGIVNTTPDSFHDGGLYYSQENAITHAQNLWNQGAAVLDIGGASSRPGAEDVSAQEEWKRISGVIEAVKNIKCPPKSDFYAELAYTPHLTPVPSKACPVNFPSASHVSASHVSDSHTSDFTPLFSDLKVQCSNSRPSYFPPVHSRPLISVDTWRAEVALKALENGADIINDISAFSWEKNILDVVAEHKPGYVLMHCQGRPQNMQNKPSYVNVVDEVIRFFEEKMNILVQRGLPESHIILDLGIGFGKSVNHNISLLQSTQKLTKLGRPILLGISYKSLFGHLLGIEAEKRESITQVCTALMARQGIRHHRVHDVLFTVQSLALQNALQENNNV